MEGMGGIVACAWRLTVALSLLIGTVVKPKQRLRRMYDLIHLRLHLLNRSLLISKGHSLAR